MNSTCRVVSAGLAALTICIAQQTSGAAVIIPVGVTASSRLFNDSRDNPANLINGNGFTSATPIENSVHTNANWNEGASNWGWFTLKNAVTPHTLDFDLGAAFVVSSAHVWNWNGSVDVAHWGVGTFSLIFSRDSVFGNLDDTTRPFTLNAATGLNNYTGQHYTFDAENGVTNIRLQITGYLPGANDGLGLSEVRFGGAIPEPSGAVLLAGGLAAFMRRRR